MALQVYATDADLGTWVDTVPPNSALLLRYASIRVAKACNISPYTTPDPTSAPVLKDATCAQAASWITLGIDPAKSGTDIPGPVKSVTLLDKKIDRDTSAATKLLEQAAQDLAEAARDILVQAGLLYVPVPLGAASTDTLPDWGQGSHWLSPYRDPLTDEMFYPYGWWV